MPFFQQQYLKGLTLSNSFQGQYQHWRFFIKKSYYYYPPSDDFAVVTVSPKDKSGDGVLIILSGTGNDTNVNVNGYSQIITFTWGLNHESNPTWIPELLLWVATAVIGEHEKPPDILALSRGVQAFMCSMDIIYVYR